MASFKKLAEQKWFFLLLAILALAAFFRFWQLAAIPPGLYPDVAINGNDAISALETGKFKLFYPENTGREGLFINLIALSFWLFGVSVWAIKIVPAIIGLLTVLGFYFLTKQLFSYLNSSHPQKIALLASFFLAISFWHVNFSRLGFRAIMVPFFLVWSFYFLFKAKAALTPEKIKNFLPSTIGYFVLAGLFFGLGFHTYISFRVAPLILLVPIIFSVVHYWPKFTHLWRTKTSFWRFIKESYCRNYWWLWDIFFLAIIIAALPMILYFWQHPADFMGRSGQVSVFASENPAKTFLISTVKSLGMFNVWGDCNWRHNYACQPALFWPIGILFLIGLMLSLVKIIRPSNYKKDHSAALEVHWTILVWFGAMLLPAALTNEGLPHALRSIGAIPPVFIWTGLGAWWLIQKTKLLVSHKNFRAEKTGLTVVLAVLLLTFTLAEFTRYFIDWGKQAEVYDNFTQRFFNEGYYLRSLPPNVQKYLLVNESGVPVPYPNGLPMPAQTIIFFNRQTPNIKYFIEDPASPIPLDQILKTSDPLVILLMKPDEKIFEALSKIFPSGQIQKISDFKVFKINY